MYISKSIYCIPRTMFYSFIPALCQIQAIWRSVSIQYSTVPIHYAVQYYLTVPYNGKYVPCLPLYIHTQEFAHYLYLHLKYITVHRTFPDTTVQLYLRTVYILGEQYTVHTRLTVHIITCSLFTLTLLTAALPQYYVTARGCLSVCLWACLS